MKYSKALIILLLLVCSTGAMARGDKRGRKSGPEVERTVAAAADVSISVCQASGDIVVRGWDRNQVRARSDASELDLRRSGAGGSESAREIVVVTSNDQRRPAGPCFGEADIEIDVPRGATVKVQLREGNIQVTDVAEVQAKTMNGNIDFDGIKSAAEADALSGNVSLKNSTGSAKLHSVGGNVEAERVGPAAAGDSLDAGSVGGDVTIDKNTYARLEAGTVGGDLNISGPLARGAQYELKTISGDIHLMLPADSSFRLDARLSQNAEFDSGFPMKITNEKDSTLQAVPRAPVPPRKKHGVPVPPAPPRTVHYGLQHINAVYGTGDALLTISSFSGAVSLQKK